MEQNLEPKNNKKHLIIAVLLGLLLLIVGAGIYVYSTFDDIVSEVVLPTTQDKDELKSAYDQLLAYEGVWEGEWTNNIFNNKGTVRVEVDVKEDGTIVALTDLNGKVFGWKDPQATAYTGTYTKDGAFFAINTDSSYGTVNVFMRPDKTIVIHGAKIPLKRVELVTGAGTFDETKAHIDYSVDWIGSFGTNGTVDLKKVN